MNSKVTAILDWLRGQHDKGLVRNVAPALAFLYCTLAACTPTTTPDTPYLGASHVPDSMPGWLIMPPRANRVSRSRESSRTRKSTSP